MIYLCSTKKFGRVLRIFLDKNDLRCLDADGVDFLPPLRTEDTKAREKLIATAIEAEKNSEVVKRLKTYLKELRV